MKILKKNVQFLTNVEALSLIEDGGNFELCKENPVYDLNEIELKKRKLKDLGLYEFEIIQLINLIPKQILHLQLVIEEMEERFDEDTLGKILKIFEE